MRRLHAIGFSTPELVIVILVIGALFGVGGYVWSKNTSQRTDGAKTSSPATSTMQERSSAEPDPFKDWRTYTNNELGFTFKYPRDWGTASVSREALNNEKYETNLPYVVKFSSGEAPQARIFPGDWKFDPPFATEWNKPLTREFLQGELMVRVVEDQVKIASIYFSSFGGDIDLIGLKLEVLPKVNASQVEFRQGSSYKTDPGCLMEKTNSAGSSQKYPTLDCYPETYRDNFVKFIDSFTAI